MTLQPRTSRPPTSALPTWRRIIRFQVWSVRVDEQKEGPYNEAEDRYPNAVAESATGGRRSSICKRMVMSVHGSRDDKPRADHEGHQAKQASQNIQSLPMA